MAEEDKTADAYKAIGRFMCAFSELDYELGETVKAIFRLHQHESADAFVGLVDFAKKATIVKSAIEFARELDGQALSAAWKTGATNTVNDIHSINQSIRVFVAHARLRPVDAGGVSLDQLRPFANRQEIWSQADFATKCARLEQLTEELRQIHADLSTFVYEVDPGSFSISGSDAYLERSAWD